MALRLLISCLVPAVTAAVTRSVQIASQTGTSLAFNLTAINGRDGESVLECWQLKRGFSRSSVPGQNGTLSLNLGDFSGASFGVLPSQFDGGEHNAPEVHDNATRLVYFISGLAHITLPDAAKGEVWIQGGKYGLIAAADTSDVSRQGHITRYPSMADTVALSMPLVNWSANNYTVLHDGPCMEEEMSAL